VAVEGGGIAPDRVDCGARSEELAEVWLWSPEGVGDDCPGSCLEPAGGVIVDPLLTDLEGSLGEAGL
jgi:hypothetical protein